MFRWFLNYIRRYCQAFCRAVLNAVMTTCMDRYVDTAVSVYHKPAVRIVLPRRSHFVSRTRVRP
jgi:hypothetical protein